MGAGVAVGVGVDVGAACTVATGIAVGVGVEVPVLVRSVITEDDGSELSLVPAAFVAVTVNVYSVV